jgi:hypothetical protein
MHSNYVETHREIDHFGYLRIEGESFSLHIYIYIYSCIHITVCTAYVYIHVYRYTPARTHAHTQSPNKFVSVSHRVSPKWLVVERVVKTKKYSSWKGNAWKTVNFAAACIGSRPGQLISLLLPP